ncbi:MAG: response regulator [bacterium]|nr:response regulator [bacterium]
MSARIMVVEDEIAFAFDLRNRIENLGHTVVAHVTSGEAALQKVEQVQPDLILMDIRLSGKMDGIEAAEAIRSQRDLPIVFLTAYADDEELARARLVLPYGYLLKPIEDRELKVTIGMALYAHEADRRRRRAEETIKISERNYHGIFNAANDAIFVHDIEAGAIVDVNRSMCEMFGYTREEAVKLRMDDLSQGEPPYTMDHARQWIRTAVEGPQRFEGPAKRKNGEIFWCEINLMHVVIDGLDRIAAFVSDVTVRKQAEEVRQLERARLVSILDAIPDGIYIVSQQWNIEYINPGIEREFGPVEGRKCYEYFHDRTEVCPWCKNPEVFAGKSVQWEWYSFKNDRHYELFDTPFKNADGSISKFEIFHDVTERKQLEKERERAGIFMQTVIDGAPDVLMVVNRDYTIALANRMVHELAGGKDPVAACMKCHQITHRSATPCDDLEHPCALKLVVATKAAVTVEHLHVDAEGRAVAVEIRAAPILDEEGEVLQVIEVCRDITERKRAEEEKLALERQVQHAQKLESLGVLAGGIAHDFNNLLMTILGNAELALDELSPHAPARDSIQAIEDATKRAAELTKEMLAYSGRGRFVVETIDLGKLVEEMAHLLDISISKKAVLKYNLADNLPSIDGDATQIRQIIMNLLTNASEAIGDKSGVIALSTGAMDCDRAWLDEAGEDLSAGLDEPTHEGIYVYVEVADTGCGMDKATIGKMFDPFFTTKTAGRGLGMSATLGIVRGHKGTIKIHSELGKGTTFKVLFPANESPENGAASRRRDEGGAEGWQGEGTVLIVDDDQRIRAVVKKMLGRMGFDVLTAPDGCEGVQVFREHADEIVCVLLDLTMPHMDGEETFREMRRIRPDVRVILCSGYSMKSATQQEPAGFIQKPYKMAALKDKLIEVLG